MTKHESKVKLFLVDDDAVFLKSLEIRLTVLIALCVGM